VCDRIVFARVGVWEVCAGVCEEEGLDTGLTLLQGQRGSEECSQAGRSLPAATQAEWCLSLARTCLLVGAVGFGVEEPLGPPHAAALVSEGVDWGWMVHGWEAVGAV